LLAKDIVDISKFNFYPVVGLTAGVRHFRINVSYQYGINNILDNLRKSLGYNSGKKSWDFKLKYNLYL
jgi:hypothetical protein